MMRRTLLFIGVWAIGACTSGDDNAGPAPASGLDAGSHDATITVDGTSPVDATSDTSLGDTGASDAADSAADSPADSATDSPLDAGVDAADASDASDAATDGPLPCTPITDIDAVYYSRSATLSDGGAASFDGGPTPSGTMWIARGDGTSDTPLALGHWPRLSPDHRYVLYQTGSTDFTAGSLYVHDLSPDAGADTFIYSSSPDHIVGWTWTPDSASVVFDYLNQTNEASRTGSNEHTLYTFYDGYSDAPQASPVGGSIVFHNQHFGLGLVNPDGSSAHAIPNTIVGDYWPTWSADGAWIVFVHQDGNVFKIRPDGSGRTQLTPALDAGDGFVVQGGAVTADSAKYVSVATVRGLRAIYALPLDGSGTYERLCTGDGADLDFVGSITGPAGASDAGADASSGVGWTYVRVDDCAGNDQAIGYSTGSDLPVDADCTTSDNGVAAVCWDQTTYTNSIVPGSQPGCTYKTVTPASCTGGGHPGYMYVCNRP